MSAEKGNAFEKKVKSMKASELVLVMVEGLESPAYRVDMDTYGETVGGICYGCAATNAIAKITGEAPKFYGWATETWYKVTGAGCYFIAILEEAFNALRVSNLHRYNSCANDIGIALMDMDYPEYLPILSTDNYKEHLEEYRKLANWLQERGK